MSKQNFLKWLIIVIALIIVAIGLFHFVSRSTDKVEPITSSWPDKSKQQSASVMEGFGSGDSNNVGIQVAPNDKELKAASKKAQESTGFFTKHLGSPGEKESNFAVKVGFYEQEAGEDFLKSGKALEAMWISELTFDDKVLIGKLENEPRVVKKLKRGDEVKVDLDEIIDWMYTDDGCLVGGYTLRVLRARLPDAQKNNFDNANGYILCD